MIGGMTKTPPPSVRYDDRTDYIGGAAVVAAHRAAAGARVTLSTVLGDDPLKEFILAELQKIGVECKAIIDHTRPTTHKNAFLCGDYRLLKVDTVDNRSISDSVVEKIAAQIAFTSAQAVVFSDFRHGIFNRRTIPELVAAVAKDAFRVADSQVANRWGNILDFHGFDLITPNEREARFALADQDSTIRPMGRELYKQAGCKVLILKLGERGVITFRAQGDAPRTFLTVDSFAGNVVDPVGAGDALLSYATLSLVATKSPVIASILGSVAAAIACERDGNNPIAPDEVVKKLDLIERQLHYT